MLITTYSGLWPGAEVWRRLQRTTTMALKAGLLFGTITAFAQEDLNTRPDLSLLLFELQQPVVAPGVPTPASDPVTQSHTGPPVDLFSWLLASRQTPAPLETIDTDIANYQQAIRSFELEAGPFSLDLPQQLIAQASAYSSKGDTGQALELYDRALHILRVNHGLYSLEQKQVIDQQITTHLARGDLAAANVRQQYLFYLQNKALRDQPQTAMLESIKAYAQWNLFIFKAYTSSNPVYNKTSRLNIESAATQSLLDIQTVRADSLLKAQTLFQHMIEIVRENFGATDLRLAPLKKQLAQACFLYLSNFGINDSFQTIQLQGAYETSAPPLNSLCSRIAHEALKDRVNILKTNQVDLYQLTQAQLDLVDWYIFSGKRADALNTLVEAYQELGSHAVSESVLSLFNPAYPVATPNFGAQPFSRAMHNIPEDLNLAYKGYIDVEFTLSKYGSTRGVNVTGKSATTPEEVEDKLIRVLRRSQFRPRLVDGMVVEAELIQARYYYTY